MYISTYSAAALAVFAHVVLQHIYALCTCTKEGGWRVNIAKTYEHSSRSLSQERMVRMKLCLSILVQSLTLRYLCVIIDSSSSPCHGWNILIRGVKIVPDSSVDDLEQAVDFYKQDLPNADLVDEQYHLWKSRWLSIPKQERPQTLSDSMKHCCPESLPNINTLLKLFATLSLSSCSCERSASYLSHTFNTQRLGQC